MSAPFPAVLRSRLSRAWWAARPGFLPLTALACLVGQALANADLHDTSPARAAVTLLAALFAHAAGNLFNDHADAVIGSDARNTARIAPFTGGSRAIQEGALSAEGVWRLAVGCAGVAAALGLWLAREAGPPLLALGIAGGLLGWAYSSPSVMLMGRGLGEFTVGLAWWLVVIGSDCALRGALSARAALVGASLGLLAAAVLLVNEFPDREADAAAGKRTAVVRLGTTRASAVFGALLAAAHAWPLPLGVALGSVSPWLACGSSPLAVAACARLQASAAHRPALRDAIVLTLATLFAHGTLLLLALQPALMRRGAILLHAVQGAG